MAVGAAGRAGRRRPAAAAASLLATFLVACSPGSGTGSATSPAAGSSGDPVAVDTRSSDPHAGPHHETGSAGSASATPPTIVPPTIVPPTTVPPTTVPPGTTPTVLSAPPPAVPAVDVLPGMPPVVDPTNIYSEAGANMLGDVAKRSKAYAYVPHAKSGDVYVIDQATFQVVKRFSVGTEVQHVVPSHDMSALYATDDLGNLVRRIDPFTGEPGETIPVFDPYNMYFTPDGKYAVSVAEAYRSLVWYDPVTWQEVDRVRYPDCKGIDHGDFTPDGRIAVFSCEFDGRVIVVDMQTHQQIRVVDMPTRNYTMGPQDLRIAPDGSKFFIADSDSDGVWVLDKDLQTVTGHVPTGDGAHGLYFSRDAKQLYVTNRHEGSISVLDAYTGGPITKWHIPGGGSPDMGNVSADGTRLWVSGRYDAEVYVLSTADGTLLARIPVGSEPHGLALMPQPGRYATGHTGVTR